MALTLGRRCSPVHTTKVRRPPQSGGAGSRHVSPSPQNTTKSGWVRTAYGRVLHPVRSWDGGHDASPRSGPPSSHAPIRTKRAALDSHTLPLGRNETIRPRPGARNRTLQPRPLNRCTPGDRPTPPTVPQRTTNRPEHAVERGDHDSQTDPEKDDARVDDEPLHREADRAGAGLTTTREPMLRAHTARVIERAGSGTR